MANFTDSITIAAPPSAVRQLLTDLEAHPHFVPDGFKQYRHLTRHLGGSGARAALELNLLGHWLPAELEVSRIEEGSVTLHISTEPAWLKPSFLLLDRGGRTEVRLEVAVERRALPFYRLRTRVKQRLRLDSDVANLMGRFLSQLKVAAEVKVREQAAAKANSSGAAEKSASPAAASKSTPAPAPAPVRPAPAPAPAKAAAPAASPLSTASPAPALAPASAKAAAPAVSPVPTAAPAPAPAPAPASAKAAAPAASPVPTASAVPAPASASASSVVASEPVRVLRVDELASGSARVVQLGAQEIALFNIEGEFYALSNKCAHRGGPLAFGLLEGHDVTCPLHSWKFDVRTGQSPVSPAARVACFSVERRGDDLYLAPRVSELSFSA
ncbi:MAG: Rieske 2Fe-2S domain-containing protein [Myxococcota bacterium]